jgi:hypothetical protein
MAEDLCARLKNISPENKRPGYVSLLASGRNIGGNDCANATAAPLKQIVIATKILLMRMMPPHLCRRAFYFFA